jgi:RNA polymerase sigma-70 factor (ECF subfamily)
MMLGEPDQLYERLLVLRCQTGDEEAFAEIVGHYQPRLRYYARKMLYGVSDPDDVLQDIWLEVFRAIPRLQHIGAFRAWLYGIARARVARVFRRRRLSFESFDETDLANSCDDSQAIAAEDAESVHAALDRLASSQREVLVLRYLEAMSTEEIAEIVQCPVGTVRSRLHYAKRSLREQLEKEHRDE